MESDQLEGCCIDYANYAKVYVGTTLCGILPAITEANKVQSINCDAFGSFIKIVTGRGDFNLRLNEVDVYTNYPSMNEDGKIEILFNKSQLSKWQFKVKGQLNSIPSVFATSNEVIIEIVCGGSEKIYVDTADRELVIQPQALASEVKVYDFNANGMRVTGQNGVYYATQINEKNMFDRFKSTNPACPISEI